MPRDALEGIDQAISYQHALLKRRFDELTALEQEAGQRGHDGSLRYPLAAARRRYGKAQSDLTKMLRIRAGLVPAEDTDDL